MSGHKEKCCDPAKFNRALHDINSPLPGNKKTSEGANRFLVPEKEKKWREWLKKHPKPKSKSALGEWNKKRSAAGILEDVTDFAIHANYGPVPVVDGYGNLLGTLAAKATKINWGMIKRMPEYDLDRMVKKVGNWWKVDPKARSIEWVYAFATGMHIDSSRLTAMPFHKAHGERFSVSAWIPRNAIVGSEDPHNKTAQLFDCSKDCMSSIAKKRVRKGKTSLYRFIDMEETEWTSKEFEHSGKGSDKANDKLQKRFGPQWENSKPGDPPNKAFPEIASPKLSIAEIMTRVAIYNMIRPNDPKHPKKKVAKVVLAHVFPNACIAAGKAKGDTNDETLGDYLARNLGAPPELRFSYLLWATPGSGGVAMDTIPLNAHFHRLPQYRHTSPIYKVGKTHSTPTSKKITWYYGFVEYGEGVRHGKKSATTARSYGWVLKNQVERVPKAKSKPKHPAKPAPKKH